jgi:hypothetical protein
MVKTPWSENDCYIVSKNYLEGIDYISTAKILSHLKLCSVKMKYQNCLYLHRGNVKGSLQHASKIHKNVWNKLVPVINIQESK